MKTSTNFGSNSERNTRENNVKQQNIDNTAVVDKFLSKGANFPMASTMVPVLDMISSVEVAIHNKDGWEMEKFRWKLRTEMDKTRKLPSNINGTEKEVIKCLKGDQSIKCLPADI